MPYRQINIEIWSDPWIQELTPNEKLVFLYFCTSEVSRIAGIYEVTVKNISYRTGLPENEVKTIIEHLQADQKIMYDPKTHEVALKNWARYQGNTSPFYQKAVTKELNQVKSKKLIPYAYPMEPVGVSNSNTNSNSNSIPNSITEIEGMDTVSIGYDDFEDFWKAYGKDVGKKKCLELWKKITPGGRAKILESLPNYINATPKLEFRLNPFNYLKDERWNDAIIKNGKKSGPTLEGTRKRLDSYTD